MGSVYKITNTITNISYIGSSINATSRFKQHIGDLRLNKHHNIYLQRAFNKYGESSFILEILYENVDNYKDIEYQLINENYNKLYNVSKQAGGGDLISYHPNRELIVEKMKESLVKRFNSPDFDKSKLSRPGEENPNWKGGISKAYCKCGTEMSVGSKTCSKCRDRYEQNNPFYSKKHSDVTKAKISKSRAGKATYSRSVTANGIVFESLNSAAKELNTSPAMIIYRIKSDLYPTYFYNDK